jgi:hypothetical protein
MTEHLNQPVVGPALVPPVVEAQAQEVLNPRVLGIEGTTEAVGAELALFETKLGEHEASTGRVDEEAHRVLELVPDVIKQAQSYAFDSGNPSMSLSEAIKGRAADLRASGALDPDTKGRPQDAELVRLYSRAIKFAAGTAGKAEGDYKYYYDQAAKAPPANSRQPHAATARGKLFAKYSELGQTEGNTGEAEASPALETAQAEGRSTEPMTRAEKVDMLSAEEKARMLSDPDSVTDILQESRRSANMLAAAAKEQYEQNRTPATERAYRQQREHLEDFFFLTQQVREWEASHSEGSSDFGTFMEDQKRAQDAELAQYAEAGGGAIPPDVDRRMDQFDRAYRAYTESGARTTFATALQRHVEYAQSQANG